MKKALFSIIALVAIISSPLFASADTGLSLTGTVTNESAISYYNSNKGNWTLEANTLGFISVTSSIISDDPVYKKKALYYEDNVICKTGGQMCYSASTALNAFGFRVDVFTKGYELVNGTSVTFTNLYQRLYVKPSLWSQ